MPAKTPSKDHWFSGNSTLDLPMKHACQNTKHRSLIQWVWHARPANETSMTKHQRRIAESMATVLWPKQGQQTLGQLIRKMGNYNFHYCLPYSPVILVGMHVRSSKHYHHIEFQTFCLLSIWKNTDSMLKVFVKGENVPIISPKLMCKL